MQGGWGERGGNGKTEGKNIEVLRLFVVVACTHRRQSSVTRSLAISTNWRQQMDSPSHVLKKPQRMRIRKGSHVLAELFAYAHAVIDRPRLLLCAANAPERS